MQMTAQQNKKENKASQIMYIISVAIFGTLGPFVRHIGVSSGELALYRALMAAVIISAFLVITKQKIPFKKIRREIPLLLLSGIAMGFNWIFLFQAYKYTTVSLATLSYYFAPVIVTVLCPLLFKEKMSPKNWICFAASTVGIVLITGIGDVSSSNDHFIGILFGLGAACLYACVILLNKYLKLTGGIHRTLLQFLSAIFVLFPYVALTSGFHVMELDSSGWICLLIVGIVHTGITYYLYFSSLKDMKGQKAAILSYIDPLIAVIISVFFLGESMTAMQIIGGVLILGFALLNELPWPLSKSIKNNS